MDPSSYPECWLYPMEERWLEQFRRDVDRAVARGMRTGIFAKVGDSNLLAYNSFYGLGCREPVWGEHAELEPVMSRYRRIELPAGADVDLVHCPDAPDRRPWNSFTRVTAAAMMGIIAEHLVIAPEEMPEYPHFLRTDPGRLPGESALETEIRLTRPLYALIQVGTNAESYGRSPKRSAAMIIELIERIRRLGPVPVVINIPPQIGNSTYPKRWQFAERTATLIAETAATARAPLVNLWLPLATGDFVDHGLIRHDGLVPDGFHLETFGGFGAPGALENSVDFRPEALRYGVNYRNLLLLEVLRELDRLAGVPAPDPAGQSKLRQSSSRSTSGPGSRPR